MTAPTAPSGNRLSWIVSDALVMTKRNLLKYVRVPSLLVFSTIQPIMFVLLFAFVFGGAIEIPGFNYLDFLMPGIFIQTALFGSQNTGVGLADDMNKGMIDRYRSLPMSRSAVLAGRTISDTIRNLFVVILMSIVGYIIGFRFAGNFIESAGALALVALFGSSFSWISATIGLAVKDVEVAQTAGFLWVFPLTFASSAFVPVETMPSWLQTFAEINPVTVAIDTVRSLVLDQPVGNGIWRLLAWIAAILLVFVPLAVNRYRKAT